MGRKYSKLEGRKVIYRVGMRSYSGVVTGAEWSIGFTLQEESTKRYLVCLNGPKSPRVKGLKFNWYIHKKGMAYAFDTIMAGKAFSREEFLAATRKAFDASAFFGMEASAKSCAFSQ